MSTKHTDRREADKLAKWHKELEFQIERVQTAHSVDIKIVDSLEDPGRVLIYMIKDLLAYMGEQPQEMHVKFPVNWWEAFKDRWYPKWARNRWPIQYEEHHLKAAVLIPEIDGLWPEGKRRGRFATVMSTTPPIEDNDDDDQDQ